MLISRLVLQNWRNFKSFDVRLQNRVFIIGPNASGKSNLLDAIRFFRDSPLTTTLFIPGSDDHFYHAQVDAQWSLSFARIGGSLAFEQHQADQFIPGNRRSNWILSLGYAVPLLKR